MTVTDTLIATYFGRLEQIPGNFRKKAFPASRAPSADERDRLEVRRTELRRALAPGGKANAKSAATILDAWPSFGAGTTAAAASIATMLEVITKHPTWACEEAVARFRNGTAVTKWDRGKVPTEAQLSDEIRAVSAPNSLELSRIDAILGAEVYQPMNAEQREELDSAIAAWTKGRTVPDTRTLPRETPDEFDARLRETASLSGLRLSDESLRRFRPAATPAFTRDAEDCCAIAGDNR